MTNSRRLRASDLLPLLVAIGLGQQLGGCNSEEPRQNGSSSVGGGGTTSTNTGNGGTSVSSTGSGGVAAPSSGGTSTGGQSQSLAGSSSGGGNAGGAEPSASAGGVAGGGTANSGASTGGIAGGGFAGGGLAGGTSTAGAAGATGGAAGTGPLSDLPAASSVLEAMQRANTYFVGRWPDPTKEIVTDKTRPSNLWTRAVYYEGLMGLYAIEPDSTKRTAYYDYAVTWGSTPAHPWEMTYVKAGTMTNIADNQACGQTYIDLYRIDPQADRIAVIKANIDDMIGKKTVNAWTWIDAIQMSMPVFAKLGKTLGDTKYFDAMWSLYAHSRNTQGGGLFNTAEGLWWRDWHFTASIPSGGAKQVMTSTLNDSIPAAGMDAYIVAPNGKNLYWSRGNGWVIAALVRVLDELPTTDGHRDQYISDFKATAAALLPIQRSDGFWTESLADPTHCATISIPNQDGPETSGTALFTYGLAWGIRNGHLDAATYGPALVKAWNGLVSIALQSNGLLGYVQNTGDRPCTGPLPLSATNLANFDDYGVGCFLLAGTEVYRLTSLSPAPGH